MLGVPLSVLDVAPVPRGTTPAQALAQATQLAQRVDALGFTRLWYAEHHNMPGIASSAPEVLIAHAAALTSRIRVGSGGVMLPNHAPLLVAERFATLEALHPGRIDLGIGRAPGSDPWTARALRRDLGPKASGHDLPQLLPELFDYFDPEEDARIRSTPGAGYRPQVWLLGSSGSSAELAGVLGLHFATAHHFSPAASVPSMAAYRARFQPSEHLAEPYGLLTVQVVVADTEVEARAAADAFALTFLRMRQGIPPSTLPNAEDVAAYPWNAEERAFADAMIDAQAVGTPEQVRERLTSLVEETGASELMATTMVPDPDVRMRSFELLAGLAELQSSSASLKSAMAPSRA
ncbi:MAG: luciferase family oxidoreductase, group 1 [Thermoleophilia bacterium]|nr:luciferase family oxidoreductase, group 1 [Thermoleophilia bacterium]MCZ4496400.1 luciferase family oxidoreductase, group 1 [Thermoleophilia bacterium]